MFYKAPTYNLDTQEWSHTPFESRKDALSFIKSYVKYPGEYNLKYSQGVWNDQATIFLQNEKLTGTGFYPKYVRNSVDFRKHWDFEKEKSLFEGFLIYKKPSENLEYVVPCLYYWYLNYCPIPDKVKQKETFPEVYDGDLHYFLYILECILVRQFGVVLKKRQCFLEDSLVYTPKGVFRIDKLAEEDYQGEVWSYDPNTKRKIKDTIQKVMKGKRVKSYSSIHTYSGHYIECSLDHRIFTAEGWKKAKDITDQDTLVIFDGGNGKVVSNDVVQGFKQLYDIETTNTNSFFVNGIYVHNSGYTLKNMAIILNAIWFGNAAMAKVFASDESKVKESWSFMTRYRDHINSHCGWTRAFDPGKPLDWHIRRKRVDGSYIGNQSQAKGFTTKQNPSNGVGGSAKVIFGEESGLNSSLDKTHEFITSNVTYGGLTTGLIIYSGAVGELDQAEPLKEFILHALEHGFVTRPNNIEDDLEFGAEIGFFAPEWWNYMSVERDEHDNPSGEALRCFDVWGNSNKAIALSEIKKWRLLAKQRKPEGYRYYCSQRPLSIKEAFAFRKDSKFPLGLIEAQTRRINDKEYPYECLDIGIDKNGLPEFIKSDKLPIKDFPFSPSAPNKEGIPQVWERPVKNVEFGLYFASVDPVRDGRTKTSDSLFSIIIRKNDVEVTKVINGEPETFIEHGKIVATWTGRFDDVNDTNFRAWGMVMLYKAWTICEANVSSFINYMIGRKCQHLLVPKKEIGFLKDLGSNEFAFQDYGYKTTGDLFTVHMLSYAVQSLKEVLHTETKPDGTIVRTVYGVERIPDIMILKEMIAYADGVNVDRLVAYSALESFVKIQTANRGYKKRVEITESSEATPKGLYDKPSSFFNARKNNPESDLYNVKKGYFKNMK